MKQRMILEFTVPDELDEVDIALEGPKWREVCYQTHRILRKSIRDYEPGSPAHIGLESLQRFMESEMSERNLIF